MKDNLPERLQSWYAHEKHRYEFRLKRDIYRTWITEIFLQQTQINAAKEKLKFFLATFPTVTSLAQGDISEVLQCFQGMGYYTRARNMHRAAQIIVKDHHAKIPTSYTALKKIPGIGHYTAAMLASIHGKEKILALDANHVRVLSRLYEIPYTAHSQSFADAARKYAEVFLESTMPPGDVNEALMQWGQIICTKTPKCSICFASEFCKSFQNNTQNLYPQKTKRVEAVLVNWIMLIYRYKDKYQVFFNDGNFPFLKGELLFASIIDNHIIPKNFSKKGINEIIRNAEKLPVDIHHAITHHKIAVKLMEKKHTLPNGDFFTLDELQKKCHSSLMQKVLKQLRNPKLF